MAFYNAKSAYVEITKTKFRKNSAKRSLVELIVDTRDHLSEQRWQLLDITPISEITKDYWEPYKYIYAVLMIAHVVYMAVFSEFSLQMTMVLDLSCAYGANETSSITSSLSIRRPPSTTGSSGFLLIWPCLIIISDVTYCASYLERRLQSLSALKSLGRASTSRSLCSQLIQQFRHLEVIDVATYWLVGVAFSWMAVVWFILHAIGDCHQDYVLAVVMISGWLYTINFTQGIQGVHHFSLVLQQIVLKDFLKFAFVFVSLLVGYSYAFQVLTLAIPSLRSQSIGSTFFKVFNWLIGMDDFYKVQHEEFERHGKDSVVLLTMFVSYILLLNILLVNLLVAIMNDSYSSIYRRHRLMWRINSLRHALNIENHFPFVGNMLRKLLNKEIVRNSSSQHERFYLKVAKCRDDSSSDGNSEQCSLAAISSRLDSLAVTSDRLEHTMVELKERLDLLIANERKQPLSAVMSHRKATVSAAEHDAA